MQIKAFQYLKKSSIVTQIYLLLYIAIMFSGSTFIKPYVTNLVLIVVILLGSMVFIKGVPRDALLNRRDKQLFFLIILFTIFLIFQLSIAYVPSIVIVYIKRYFLYAFLLLLIPKIDVAACAIKLSKYYSFIVAGSIILMTFITGEKTGGLVGNYQFAGMLMSIACILFLIDYFNNNVRKFNLIGCLFCLCALLMSGKRMFAILVVISFLVIYIKSESKNKIQRLFAAIVIISVGIVAMYYFIPSARELFERILELSSDEQTLTSGRNVLWEKAIDIFKDNKIYGIGFGAFETYFGDHFVIRGISAYLTHNIYFGLLAETGIIGFTVYIVFMISTLIKTLRLSNAVRKAEDAKIKYVYTYSLLLQIWFVVYGFTGNGIYDADETFFYFSAIAMMLAVKNHLINTGELKNRRMLRM